MSGLVTRIKRHHHISVANAMYELGWSWRNPKRRPTNIERMVEGLPRWALEVILHKLEAKP